MALGPEGNLFTCIACGGEHVFHGKAAIIEHMAVCPRHPLSKACDIIRRLIIEGEPVKDDAVTFLQQMNAWNIK